MTDALWTDKTTETAVAMWIAGRDPAEIAAALGTSPEDVVRRVAQAALATPKAAKSGAAEPQAVRPEPAAPRAAGPQPSADPRSVAKPAVVAPRPAASAPKPAVSAPRPAVSAPRPAVSAPRPAVVAPPPAALAPVTQPRVHSPTPVPPAPPRSVAPHQPALPVAAAPTGPVLPTPLPRRPLVAADGGEGIPFMKAGLLDCVFPLWSDHEPVSIESKRVCGCRAITGKRWCAQHYAVVFEPMKKPLRAA
ncbi:hypothetical protein [Methylobacterium nigriterrae]|uniref:hypothetical protein n=1 Tax=Methylobacterium nigriterrae TaxID=3127512 RepID=UPI0030139DD2